MIVRGESLYFGRNDFASIVKPGLSASVFLRSLEKSISFRLMSTENCEATVFCLLFSSN